MFIRISFTRKFDKVKLIFAHGFCPFIFFIIKVIVLVSLENRINDLLLVILQVIIRD